MMIERRQPVVLGIDKTGELVWGKYEGRWEEWEDYQGDTRLWTLISHFVDANGYDRMGSSFGLTTLVKLQIVSQEGLL